MNTSIETLKKKITEFMENGGFFIFFNIKNIFIMFLIVPKHILM